MADLTAVPLFEALRGRQRVLVAGAGGGFDVFSGLPLYFALRARGIHTFLANLSFTRLERATGRRLTPDLVEVTADSTGPERYFPELHLARHLRQQGEEAPIYAFARTGYQPLAEAYRALAAELRPDALVLVDGGTDSLMRGDEAGLGTPEEDVASMAAADATGVPVRLLTCLGFGIDAFHGVCHAQFLEAVADLAREGAFRGAFSLLGDHPEALRYEEAVAAVTAAMPDHPSIVSTSIVSALQGRFGNHHATARTAGSTLFINPLMTLYWTFDLGAVVHRILYLEALRRTRTFDDVRGVILRFRAGAAIKDYRELPL